MSNKLRCEFNFELGRNTISNAQPESKRELLTDIHANVFARTQNEKNDNNRRDFVYAKR